MEKKIGTLTKVEDIRGEMWRREDKNFTPWLANNAVLLGKALGMDLEHHVVETEARVGARLRSDVVFRDDSTQNTVVVENMFGTSDHDHLGKLISYAAGLGAACAVLISEELKDEHRRALEWLNSSSADLHFFGVVIEGWRIDDSPPAPWLRVEVEPHDKQDNQLADDLQRRYRSFWAEFMPAFRSKYPDWTHQRKPQPSNSMFFPLYLRGFRISCALKGTYPLRVELYHQETEKIKALYQHKARIEAILGESLDWSRGTYISLNSSKDASDDREAREWLIEAADRMRQAFTPFLKNLPP